MGAILVALHGPNAMRRTTLAVGAVVLLVAVAATPATAVGPPGDGGGTETCTNAGDETDGGPPGVVADLVPGFLGDLLGSLSVPGAVASALGGPGC